MADDFQIRNLDDLERAIKRIKAGDKVLRRELYSGLNRVSKGIRGQMKEAIPAALPQRGGLAATVQRSTRFNTTAKTGRNLGVTIWAKNSGHDIRTLTGRRLRHPVWGHRGFWVNQTAGVYPAVFLASFEKQKPEVQQAIIRVIEDVARKVEG